MEQQIEKAQKEPGRFFVYISRIQYSHAQNEKGLLQ